MMGSPTQNPYHGISAIEEIVEKRINPEHTALLEQIPNDIEINEAIFSINSNKAPGPDGYNSFFFKHCWEWLEDSLLKLLKNFS